MNQQVAGSINDTTIFIKFSVDKRELQQYQRCQTTKKGMKKGLKWVRRLFGIMDKQADKINSVCSEVETSETSPPTLPAISNNSVTLQGDSEKSPGEKEHKIVKVNVSVLTDFFRHIVGKNGGNITKLQTKHSVQIKVPRNTSIGKEHGNISIHGLEHNVQAAQVEIEEMVRCLSSRRAPQGEHSSTETHSHGTSQDTTEDTTQGTPVNEVPPNGDCGQAIRDLVKGVVQLQRRFKDATGGQLTIEIQEVQDLFGSLMKLQDWWKSATGQELPDSAIVEDDNQLRRV